MGNRAFRDCSRLNDYLSNWSRSVWNFYLFIYCFLFRRATKNCGRNDDFGIALGPEDLPICDFASLVQRNTPFCGTTKNGVFDPSIGFRACVLILIIKKIK